MPFTLPLKSDTIILDLTYNVFVDRFSHLSIISYSVLRYCTTISKECYLNLHEGSKSSWLKHNHNQHRQGPSRFSSNQKTFQDKDVYLSDLSLITGRGGYKMGNSQA